MKADITRYIFRPEQRYARVIQQQGRVPLDSDWNEQVAIDAHRDETEAIDVIGPEGFPQGTSFALGASPDGKDILIGSGTGYVGGMLCENLAGSVDVLGFPDVNKIQLRTLEIDGTTLRPGQWFMAFPTPIQSINKPAQIQFVDAATQTITVASAPWTKGADASKWVFYRLPSYCVQPDWYAPDLVVQSSAGLPQIDPNASGKYLAYLDVWHRHVTALEDPLIREVALGGPDTTTRAKTVWQVKLLNAGNLESNVDCTTPLPTQKSTGRLSARAKQPSTGDTPCVIQPGARYRSLENQLYRVEIHDPGQLGAATFKFSRDNGMVLTSWVSSSGTQLVVGSLGRDSVLGFAGGQWIELLDDAVEESGKPGTLIQIKSVDQSLNQITVDPNTVYGSLGYDISKFPLHPRIRRWDQVSTTLSVHQSSGDGFIDLEQGVQVRFEAGDYETGDYWLIPARTITADVEWPQNESGTPLPQARRGTRHVYARLGIVTISGGQITGVADCRAQFPPLTNLPPAGASASSCCCGVSINPGDDAQTLIDNAIAAMSKSGIRGMSIEFAAGDFQLAAPLSIKAPSAGLTVTIRGCGSSTRLLALGSESALRVVDWQNATVRDLFAETGSLGQGQGQRGRPDSEPPPAVDVNRHLLGCVYVHNCREAHIERLELKCAPGSFRAAACLTIGGLAGISWVRDCRLQVGHLQVGILLVNQVRTTVQDNFITTYSLGRDAIDKITTSPQYLSRYRRLVLDDVQVGPQATERKLGDGFNDHTVNVGGTKIVFRADAALGKAWNGVLNTETRKAFPFLIAKPNLLENIKLTPATAKAAPKVEARKLTAPTARVKLPSVLLRVTLPTPKGVSKPVKKVALKVRQRFQKMAYAVINAAANSNAKTTLTPQQLAPFRAWIDNFRVQFRSVASAGIVVAGVTGTDVRVIDNSIDGALDGVHIGFSHHDNPGDAPDMGQRVQVVGNSITQVIPVDMTRGSHAGIFIGNATSIAVKRNYVNATVFNPKSPLVLEGVRVWAKVDNSCHSVLVTENDVTGATLGIRVFIDVPGETKGQWRAADNATFGCRQTIVASSNVILTDNLP